MCAHGHMGRGRAKEGACEESAAVSLDWSVKEHAGGAPGRQGGQSGAEMRGDRSWDQGGDSAL